MALKRLKDIQFDSNKKKALTPNEVKAFFVYGQYVTF